MRSMKNEHMPYNLNEGDQVQRSNIETTKMENKILIQRDTQASYGGYTTQNILKGNSTAFQSFIDKKHMTGTITTTSNNFTRQIKSGGSNLLQNNKSNRLKISHT